MDPRTWASRITDELFKNDERRLNGQLKELIEANHDAGGPSEGFLFGGQFHTQLELRHQRAAPKKLLDKSLHDAGRLFLKDQFQTQAEKSRILQGVLVILQSCKTLQDVRDALPDTVVGLFPEMGGLPRTRPEAWPFLDKPLQLHSYEKTVELLSFYVANRILY